MINSAKFFNFVLPFIFLVLIGCGNNEEEEKQKQFAPAHIKAIKPAGASVTFTAREFDGMRLFMKFCNKCHPGGEKGKGPSLNDKPLPNFLIHTQVRKGFGKMPDFSKEELPKEELEKIIVFLRLMRSQTY
jgi:mono/diheme cytochrome c family protein